MLDLDLVDAGRVALRRTSALHRTGLGFGQFGLDNGQVFDLDAGVGIHVGNPFRAALRVPAEHSEVWPRLISRRMRYVSPPLNTFVV